MPLVKICGLRAAAQAEAVAALGVDAIGVIAVAASPRFVPPADRPALFAAVGAAAPACQGVLVVADPQERQLAELDPARGHRVIQLHGTEDPETCQRLRLRFGCQVWKALRLRSPEDLQRAVAYAGAVDALLLDAWVPDQLGGTGQPIPLDWLQPWNSPLPWWLAGGVRPERVKALLSRVQPTGVDVSSGVERSPGDKDLKLVRQLLAQLPGRPGPGGPQVASSAS
ncbi:MAG: phosphoribosylanthranilate isomerase [Cyanobacteria bacterium J06638_7]